MTCRCTQEIYPPLLHYRPSFRLRLDLFWHDYTHRGPESYLPLGPWLRWIVKAT